MADERVLLHVKLEGEPEQERRRPYSRPRQERESSQRQTEDVVTNVLRKLRNQPESRKATGLPGLGGGSAERRIREAEQNELRNRGRGTLEPPPIQNREKHRELKEEIRQRRELARIAERERRARRREESSDRRRRGGAAEGFILGRALSGFSRGGLRGAATAATRAGGAAAAGGLATIGVVGGIAAAAIGGLAAAAIATTKALSSAADELQKYNASVAIARAQQEVQIIQARMQQGQQVGELVADFVRVQTDFQKIGIGIQTWLIESFGPIAVAVGEDVAALLAWFVNVDLRESDDVMNNQILEFLNIDWADEIERRTQNLRRPEERLTFP